MPSKFPPRAAERRTSAAAVVVALLLAGCGSDNGANVCTVAAPDALRECIADYGATLAGCFQRDDGPCAADDPRLGDALAHLARRTRSTCDDGELFGLDVDAAVARLENACSSEASAVAWRSFGGPQAAVWSGANDEARACLLSAHASAMRVMDSVLGAVNTCLASETCDVASVTDARASAVSEAEGAIAAACPALGELIGRSPSSYARRVDEQADCVAAISHADTSVLPLTCGPANAAFDIPRGEWTQVIVDGDRWGTLCGDGSEYAFWVRLAPEGHPLDQLVIGLQGGGVCLVEGDCSARLQSNPELFRALDDTPTGGGGIGSDDPTTNPFANWTRVFLPYCNQDVFAGGGVSEQLGALSLPRYGSVNARAAIQMTRDVIWRELDQAGGAGYRPDEVVTLFGGWSAGGYGTLYNYHWMLDELQWPRTIAFPDGGLALDNGTLLGVRGLGRIKITAWGLQDSLPSYCFTGDCAVGPNLYRAISPRLLQVPEQQMLILSNPYDNIQQGDAFFADTVDWINTVRESYCETRDLPGIQYYLTSVSAASTHVVSVRDELWSAAVEGEVMRDWFVRAVEDPTSLTDRAEESDFMSVFPGVNAYPCAVGP